MRHKYYNQALKAFLIGINAADPVSAVRQELIGYDEVPTIIAVGKAAVKMTIAAVDVLKDYSEVIVVTNPENAVEMPGIKVFAAAHPIPDQIGLLASEAVVAALQRASKVCRPVLCLISGGGSALLPAPRDGISLNEKIELNSVLLSVGAEIKTINLIRQQVSLLKGGGFLQYAAPSSVTSLILSDVVEDDLRVVSSGLTTSPIGSREEARLALKRLGIWDSMPESIQVLLQRSDLAPVFPKATNTLIGSNKLSLEAMSTYLERSRVHYRPLVGDVAVAAKRVASSGLGIHLFGGETTVKINGTGKGGRNQELALRVALLAREQAWTAPWLYLQGGTDGRDGPTDAAGGVVCETTLNTLESQGINSEAMLSNNDSYNALKAANALLITGPTGTNVADLGILIKG
mgnify:CR=1 FL=1|jgi:hydroxypyruvate reductase